MVRSQEQKREFESKIRSVVRSARCDIGVVNSEMTRAEQPTEKDPRWAAVVARDRGADGAFYYSVATTGVYCRPSCGARLAHPRNVRFHATGADA